MFKLTNLSSGKGSILKELRSHVICKFTCACCNACHISKTGRHFPHLSMNISHQTSPHTSIHLWSIDHFKIVDSASTKFQLKIKEVMHVNWEKPDLNQQIHHVNLTLTL